MFWKKREPAPAWPVGLPPLAVREAYGRIHIADEHGERWTDDDRLAHYGVRIFWCQGTYYNERAAKRSDTSPGRPAVLQPEPGNPYDSNAIAVYASGKRVAHIAEDETGAARSALKHSHAARFFRGEPSGTYSGGNVAVITAPPATLDLLFAPPDPSRFAVRSYRLRKAPEYQDALKKAQTASGGERFTIGIMQMVTPSGKFKGEPMLGFGAYGMELGQLLPRYETDRPAIAAAVARGLTSASATIGVHDETGRLACVAVMPE